MNRVFTIAAIASLALVSGCLAGPPETAAEFRAAVPESATAEIESFEVARPWRDIAETIRDKAPRCLKVSVTSPPAAEVAGTDEDDSLWTLLLGDPDEEKSRHDTTMEWERPLAGRTTVSYTPTVAVSDERAELHLQSIAGNSISSGGPPNGAYVLVADFVPTGAMTTRVDLYRPIPRFTGETERAMIASVRGWADGSDMSCPALAGR